MAVRTEREPVGENSLEMLNANVTMEQVLRLVDMLGERASPTVDIGRLSTDIRAGADILPVITVANKLELVSVKGDSVSITEAGSKLYGASSYKNKAVLLKDPLTKVEPFNTAMALISDRGKITAHQLSIALQEQGLLLYQDSKLNESLITSMLIDWAVDSELLRLNKKGEFESFSTPEDKRVVKPSFRSKTEAYQEFRRSRSAAKKKLQEARAEAWRSYRKELSDASAAHKRAISKLRKK
jgi:hypothetical protein